MNENKRIAPGIIILIIMLVANLAFIWLNSFVSGSLSNTISRKIAGLIQQFIDPNYLIPNKIFSGIIRKSAHFFEFFMFGAEITLFHIVTKKPRITTLLLILLSAAVTDETIQMMSDRTDSVKDIIIDLSGSLTGMTVVFMIYFIVTFITHKIKITEQR